MIGRIITTACVCAALHFATRLTTALAGQPAFYKETETVEEIHTSQMYRQVKVLSRFFVYRGVLIEERWLGNSWADDSMQVLRDRVTRGEAPDEIRSPGRAA